MCVSSVDWNAWPYTEPGLFSCVCVQLHIYSKLILARAYYVWWMYIITPLSIIRILYVWMHICIYIECVYVYCVQDEQMYGLGYFSRKGMDALGQSSHVCPKQPTHIRHGHRWMEQEVEMSLLTSLVNNHFRFLQLMVEWILMHQLALQCSGTGRQAGIVLQGERLGRGGSVCECWAVGYSVIHVTRHHISQYGGSHGFDTLAI